MEIVDLYTADRLKTNQTIIRGEPTPPGLYRTVVHVCIFDTAGRMLIQHRQPFVKGWSGFWDVSAAGGVRAGETSREAAERETLEELGISVSFSDSRPSFTFNFIQGFDDYFVRILSPDLSSLNLQQEEVESARWASMEEILQMIDNGSFIPYEKSLIELLFFCRNHHGAHTRQDPTR